MRRYRKAIVGGIVAGLAAGISLIPADAPPLVILGTSIVYYLIGHASVYRVKNARQLEVDREQKRWPQP